MVRQKDLEILHHLRNNARDTLTSISKKMKIPVTTVYDRVLASQKRYIKRYTSLIDFQKLGLNIIMFLSLKIPKGKNKDFEIFLSEHPNINSAFKTDFEGNYLIELISENSSNANDFVTNLENNFGTQKIQIYTVTQELLNESILTKPEHIMAFSRFD